MVAIRVSKKDRIAMGVDPSEATPKCDYCSEMLHGWAWEHKGNLICRGCYSEVGVCQIDGCEQDGDPASARLALVRDHGDFDEKEATIILCYRHADVW